MANYITTKAFFYYFPTDIIDESMPDEFHLSDLPEKDYSQNPREQTRFHSQLSAIRYMDPCDQTDALRLKSIIESDKNKEKPWMEDLNLTDRDYQNWMNEKGPGKNRKHHLFAVSGSQKIPPGEIGEIQGFVYFYFGSDEQKQLDRVIKEGIINPRDLIGKRILEISYAKHPKAPPGRMVGGIIQACTEVSRITQQVADNDPTNLIILAYTDPVNSNSEKAAEYAGFTQIGTVSGYGEDNIPNHVYTLDWKKLDENLRRE
jgi:hypothetical protein